MFTLNDVVFVANELGITFDKFSVKDFLTGMNIELEHGTRYPLTNITNNDALMTAKITLAHLIEYPNYYNEEYGLPAFEKILEEKLK